MHVSQPCAYCIATFFGARNWFVQCVFVGLCARGWHSCSRLEWLRVCSHQLYFFALALAWRALAFASSVASVPAVVCVCVCVFFFLCFVCSGQWSSKGFVVFAVETVVILFLNLTNGDVASRCFVRAVPSIQ